MIDLLALEVTIPVAGLVVGSRVARTRLRARAERRWRHHQTARYAACLRNIDRLEHELGISLPAETHERAIARLAYWGDYARSAAPVQIVRSPYDMKNHPGVVWTVDDPGDVRELH